CATGALPAGNAIVSVRVDDIDALPLDDVTVGLPVYCNDAPYKGRKTQVMRGAQSELVELIEIRKDH
ncbi:MAG: hypothetical protein AAF004_15665, partial [Pseudomonadota bacterium]